MFFWRFFIAIFSEIFIYKCYVAMKDNHLRLCNTSTVICLEYPAQLEW